MNQDQLIGIARIIIPAVCTWLAAKGLSAFGDAGIVAQITALVIGAIAVGWSFYSHTDAAKIKAAAKIDPEVKIVVPANVIASSKSIQTLVHDDNVPNVTGSFA